MASRAASSHTRAADSSGGAVGTQAAALGDAAPTGGATPMVIVTVATTANRAVDVRPDRRPGKSSS